MVQTINDDLLLTGPTSDYLISRQDGNGRVQHKWNATLGTSENYRNANEPAWFWDVNVIGDRYMEYKYAPAQNNTGKISWKTHMSFNKNGNVAIGAQNALGKLHVDGSLILEKPDGSIHGSVNANEQIRMGGPSSDYIVSIQDGNGRIQHKWNATWGKNEKYLVANEPAWFWDVNVTGDTYMEFKYGAATSNIANNIVWQNHLAIKKDGKIGMGTTNPSRRLEVAGTVKADAFETPNGLVSGNVAVKTVASTSQLSYTIKTDDKVILLKIGHNSNNMVLTLPSVTEVGQIYYLKVIEDGANGGKAILITPGLAKIDGGNEFVFGQISGSVGSVSVVSDGSDWWILNTV